ncbi:N-acetyllactosaminide 3-alpha-galactosyltransferase, partial [Opisthorchis viverrini]
MISRTLFLLGQLKDKNASRESTVLQQNLELEQTKYHDIVQFDFVDSYANNTYKILSAMEFVSSECPMARFVVILDDDFLVHPVNLIKTINQGLENVRKPWFIFILADKLVSVVSTLVDNRLDLLEKKTNGLAAGSATEKEHNSHEAAQNPPTIYFLIFYVRTGLMLTTGSKPTSLTTNGAAPFLAVAKWIALVLLIVGGLLLVSGVILCYINRRMTPYGLRLSDTTPRPQMTRASVNLELPK